jgi:carbonic anhydrase/acetyltransferase-like protein (isoleucine patch superfamily)
VNQIRIGRRTNIQDGTIVHVMRGTHPTTLGDEVTVGHGVILHGCTVGNRCLIGMGAVLLNGVEVGEECIIAAGALLPEGMTVPPRSLVVGHPGKVRRALRPEDVATLADYAERYVGYSRIYKDSGQWPTVSQ